MNSQPLIIEGDYTDVVEIGARYADRRMRLIVLPTKAAEEPIETPAIEAEIAEIWADVTEEQWASLPADLSNQIDHYVYGTPKK